MYSNYSEDELIDAYTTMMDYSGKAEENILNEIEKRGGLDKFKQAIAAKEENKKESDRVLNEIIKWNKEGLSLEEIKKTIQSELWTKSHLNAFIENRYLGHQLYLQDKNVDREVIYKSLLGLLIASFTGSILWCFSIIAMKYIFFPFLVAIYFISYFIIRGLTGKTHNNAVIFLAALFATIASFFVGFFILNTFFS
jgi:hypothetical protein